jgi:hypothetical protein
MSSDLNNLDLTVENQSINEFFSHKRFKVSHKSKYTLLACSFLCAARLLFVCVVHVFYVESSRCLVCGVCFCMFLCMVCAFVCFCVWGVYLFVDVL